MAGCGDRCEQLCAQAASRLQECRAEGLSSLSWEDLGARNRNDFNSRCRDTWERTSSDLTATEVREALAVCRDTTQALAAMSCDELEALYAESP